MCAQKGKQQQSRRRADRRIELTKEEKDERQGENEWNAEMKQQKGKRGKRELRSEKRPDGGTAELQGQ